MKPTTTQPTTRTTIIIIAMMTHVSYDDPSSLHTLFACTIVVLLLLHCKNEQRSDPLFHLQLTWDKFIKDNQGHLEFHHLLWMDIESFYLLLSFIHDTIQVDKAKVASHGGMIIPELCLYCTLHYLAGASYLDVSVFAEISTASFFTKQFMQ